MRASCANMQALKSGKQSFFTASISTVNPYAYVGGGKLRDDLLVEASRLPRFQPLGWSSSEAVRRSTSAAPTNSAVCDRIGNTMKCMRWSLPMAAGSSHRSPATSNSIRPSLPRCAGDRPSTGSGPAPPSDQKDPGLCLNRLRWSGDDRCGEVVYPAY